MKTIDYGTMSTTVDRENDKIYIKTIFNSKMCEIMAECRLDVFTLKVEDARYEVFRGNEAIQAGHRDIPEFIGNDGFGNDVKYLGTLASKDEVIAQGGNELAGFLKMMFLQSTQAMTQAETYIIKERGYVSEKEYEEHWQELEKNGCRHYTNADLKENTWYGYLGDYRRKRNLFNRSKYFEFNEIDGKLHVKGAFIDSYHQMKVDFIVEEGSVMEASASFDRGPSAVCFENTEHMRGFIGLEFSKLDSKSVRSIVGGAYGCYHLNDVIVFVLKVLKHTEVVGLCWV